METGPVTPPAEPGEKTPFAWQPFTPRGIAAFAAASNTRLWLVQFVMAVASALCVVWFIRAEWYPVISSAIGQMPEQGQIRQGRLEWTGPNPARLADGRFLAITVDLQHEGGARSPANLQVELGQNDVRLFSLFGYVPLPYSRELAFPVNRPELVAWWGAWSPPITGMVVGGVMLGLLITWNLLALFYSVPIWLIAFFSDRRLGFGGSWRVGGAALLPGAALMCLAIIFYGLGTVGMIELFIIFLLHWLVGWIYAWLAALSAPREETGPVAKGNPFA